MSIYSSQFSEELASVHAFHYHVDDKKVFGNCVGAVLFKCLGAGLIPHRIAQRREHFTADEADRLVVVDDDNVPFRPRALTGIGAVRCSAFGFNGEIHGDVRAASLFRADVDVSVYGWSPSRIRLPAPGRIPVRFLLL